MTDEERRQAAVLRRIERLRSLRATIIGDLDVIRKSTEIEPFIRKRYVFDLICHDMEDRGTFYRTVESEGNIVFYFKNEDKRLYMIQDKVFSKWVLFYYRQTSTDEYGRYILSEMDLYGTNTAEKVSIHKTAYYDVNSNISYIYNNAGQTYKITTQDIILVDNGADGVIFKHDDNWKEIKPVFNDNDSLSKYFLDVIRFVEADEAEAKIAFKVHIFAMLFPQLFSSRPIMLLTGDIGSGKTLILKLLMKTFYGVDKFYSSPNEVDDFLSQIYNSYIVTLDNVEEIRKHQINDIIAAIATGATIPLRTYYTTVGQTNISPDIFLILDGVNPSLRGDVLNRAIIYKIEKREKRDDLDMLRDVGTYRGEMWGDILTFIKRILITIKSRTMQEVESDFRMQGFCNFGGYMMKDEEEANKLMSYLDKAPLFQAEMLVEKEPIVEALREYLDGREKTFVIASGNLFRELKEVAKENSIYWAYGKESGPKAFGRRFKGLRDTINNYIGPEWKVSKAKEGKNNKKLYKFKKRVHARDLTKIR